jgi:hypothetical protein
VDVVEDGDQGLLARRLLERRPHRPRDLVGGRRCLALAEERVEHGGGSAVGRPHPELLQHVHDERLGGRDVDRSTNEP